MAQLLPLRIKPLVPQPKPTGPSVALGSRLEGHPDNRESELRALLIRIKAHGPEKYEREINAIRDMPALEDPEREVIREIFLYGYGAAQAEAQENKARAYQRLLRRLLLHQPLNQSIPSFVVLEEKDIVSPRRLGRIKTQEYRHHRPFSNILRKTARHTLALGFALGMISAGALLLLAFANWPRGVSAVTSRDDVSYENKHVPITKHTKTASVAAPKHPSSISNSEFKPPQERHRQAIEPIPSADESAWRAPSAASPVPTEVETKPDNPAEYKIHRSILFREEPRFGAPARRMIKAGTAVRLIESKGRWLKVKLLSDNSIGFIRREFVTPLPAHPAQVP